jgi:tRNA threonylcarbamoyladenosine biosynthesis protein TsaE
MKKHFQKLKEVAKKKQVLARKRPKPKEITKGKYDIHDLEHFREFFSEFAHQVKPGDLVLFAGDVGAGKTTAIRSMVELLGGRWVSSPSFAVHQRYAVRNGFVDHVDLYRLENDNDLESTGFWDLFDSKESIIAIEWADRLAQDVWPHDRKKWAIHIQKSGEFSRLIEIL